MKSAIRIVVSCVLVSCSVIYISTHLRIPTAANHAGRMTRPPKKPAPTTEDWCTLDECVTGHWERRLPSAAINGSDEYANPDGVSWEYCEPLLDPTWTEAERRAAGEQRSAEIRSWSWVPDAGRLKPWDAQDFVVRLLQSPGGLILIGDSITRQHFQTLTRALSLGGIAYNTTRPHKNIHHHTLNLSDPATAALQARAGVPDSRLARPIVTFLEDHMLLGEPDLRAVAAPLGAPATYAWYHDFQRVDDWETLVADAARPIPGEARSVTADTVLLMNAGAHWSRHEMNMLPEQPTLLAMQATLRHAYTHMVNLITSRLAPTPRLTVYYRATSPAHPACRTHTRPYPDPRAAHTAERSPRARLLADAPADPGRAVWDWDMFAPHNAVWRRAIARGVPGSARWVYLDVWDLALQRPDAHNEPLDCLHWCMPGVVGEWTDLLYHALFLDAERGREYLRVQGG